MRTCRWRQRRACWICRGCGRSVGDNVLLRSSTIKLFRDRERWGCHRDGGVLEASVHFPPWFEASVRGTKFFVPCSAKRRGRRWERAIRLILADTCSTTTPYRHSDSLPLPRQAISGFHRMHS